MARRPKKNEDVNASAQKAGDSNNPVEENLSTESESQLGKASAEGLEAHSHCGGKLRATRIEQGLTTKEVAKQLRLSNKQIEALEQDDFSVLPEATIVKGFLRNYAKLLKIPAESLLAAYLEMVPQKEHYSFALNPGINMKITESNRPSTSRYFMLTLGLLLGLGVWFFYQSYVQKPDPVNPMPEMNQALPEFEVPMSERVEETAATPVETAQQAVAEASSQTEAGQRGEQMATESTTDISGENRVAEHVASNVTQDAAPVPSSTKLVFSASQETWLSVINADGKEVYNKTLYAGNHDVVEVSQPLEIVVGNAHGATLTIDGKAIDLAPYTRLNVARVRLNQ